MDTNDQHYITRWAQEQLGLNHRYQTYTDWELLTACKLRVLTNTSYAHLTSEYIIPHSTLKRYLAKICRPLQCRNEQHVHENLKKGEVLRSKVLETIKTTVHKIKNGRPTYLNPDEEALVVASAEIEGAHGLPIDVNTLGSELQLVIRAVNERQSTKVITPKASSQYTRSVIKPVKNREDGHDNQRKKSRTGLVKVSSISNNRSRQSDPRLAWLMF